jgi:hypothetical protein
MNQLDRLERLAQRLIEGPFQRLFRTRLHPADLGEHLAMAIEKGRRDEMGTHLIPNYYQIMVNPNDYAMLVEQSSYDTVVAALCHHLTDLAAETDYRFCGPLKVALAKNEDVLPGRIEIETDCVSSLQGDW